jgi:hypothetical protein
VNRLLKGLVAGAAGTAAMTALQAARVRTGRASPSSVPALAAERIFEVHPENGRQRALLNDLVHWGYGSSLGALRAGLGGMGLSPPLAAAAFFGLVWATELAVLPAVRVAPPPTEWGAGELASDALAHLVYAAATTLAYEALR